MSDPDHHDEDASRTEADEPAPVLSNHLGLQPPIDDVTVCPPSVADREVIRRWLDPNRNVSPEERLLLLRNTWRSAAWRAVLSEECGAILADLSPGQSDREST